MSSPRVVLVHSLADCVNAAVQTFMVILPVEQCFAQPKHSLKP